MALTDTACRQAKPGPKPYKVADGGGLYLLVSKTGKYWRWDYRHLDKRKTLALGVYPDVSLAQARERHQTARKLLAEGVDPGEARKLGKQATKLAAANSFKSVAEQWIGMRGPTWSSDYLDKTKQLLERDIYPELGALPIDSITSAKVLAMARKIEARGAFEMPRRALVAAGQIFKFAIGLGHIQNDPAQGMTGQLNPRPPVQHYPHVTVEQLPDMLSSLEGLRPNLSVYAVKLDMLTFIRGGELRFAAWDEFDMEKAIWRVPTGRMKGRLWQKEHGADHIVPLSRQALVLLKQLHPLTGWGRLVFPGRDDPKVGVSAAAMNGVFDRIGLKGEQTVHGLRGLASTLLNDSGLFDERAIEAQLSHKEPNKVRAAYNHAAYMAERVKLMQWWADYLDRMAASNAISLARSA